MRKCEKCEGVAVKGERFCRTHRRAMLREMKASGYLRTPQPTDFGWNPADRRAFYDWFANIPADQVEEEEESYN